MAKPKKSRRQTAAPAELREETQVRRLRARLEKESLKAALSAQKAMLATYAAADRGRRNKDWRAPGFSADQAIIPDAEVMNGRARQMVRDSWVARSAVGSFARNVIGCGIIPIPQVKNEDGSLDVATNKAIMAELWRWACDPRACDVEQDQTFWQMQTLAESERATVGEGFWIAGYRPNVTPQGRIDPRRPVGFRLQAFEPEQLDTTIQGYTDPITGEVREVRGGIELDAEGVKVAYHLFSRNPNDYFFRQSLRSKRVEAKFVLHYYRKDRVRQKRGVTPLTAVLQDMRDLARYKDANLWRAVMEACIGLVEKRDIGTAGSSITGMLPRMSGDSGTTPSGMPTVDWVPGMIARPAPGTNLEAFVPQAPGNQYEPFTRQSLRGIAAGSGISYGQISRDFTQGTYSGQRQEMLEDRKEFEPLQELAAHNLIFPAYRMFVAYMALENRIDYRAFASNPQRFMEVDYVAPPLPWIDPEKEIAAIEKLIQLRLVTREEIAHQYRGRRLADIFEGIARERDEAEALDITLPEDVTAQKALQPPPTQPQIGENGGENGSNSGQNGQENGDSGALGGRLKGLLPAPKPPENGQKTGENGQKQAVLQADSAPNYRRAPDPATASCALCRFFVNGRCTAYDFAADGGYVCDAFETRPALEASGARTTAPPVQDGERKMDDPRSNFLDRGQRGVS